MSTVAQIAEAVRKGERSAVSVAEGALAAIAERDGSLHAFLSVTKDEMLAQARRILVFGSGVASGLVMFLTSSLQTLGLPVDGEIGEGPFAPHGSHVGVR